jgi:hypothetical protein
MQCGFESHPGHPVRIAGQRGLMAHGCHPCWNLRVVRAPTSPTRDEHLSPVARAGRGAGGDRAALVTLTLLSIGLPLLVAWSGGALGIPRNDDFSYAGILFDWFRTDNLQFDNWPAMTLVGQLFLARPFVEVGGADLTLLQCLTTVVGAVGVCASYLLLRSVTVRRIAIIAMLATVLGPLWAPLAASFMTDIWAYTATLSCLFVGCAGLSSQGRRRMTLLALSAGIGFVAVSIRESGLLAPLAVFSVAGWSYVRRSRSDSRRPTATGWRTGDGSALVLVVVVLGLAVGALLAWRASIPFGGPSSLKTVRTTLEDLEHLDVWATVVQPSLETLFTLGLLVLPATALVSVPRLVRRIARQHVGAAVGAILVAVVVAILALDRGPVGNYVTRELGPNLSLGSPPDRLPEIVWSAIAVLTAYSCFVLLLCVVGALARLVGGHSREERRTGLVSRTPARDVVTVFSLLSIGLMTVSGLFGQPAYDRHLLPLIPFVAAFTMVEGGLRRVGRRRFALVACSVLGAFGALGLMFSTTTAMYDDSRWQAASDLVASGFEPLRIDGGLDWVGFHSEEPQSPATDPSLSWWAASYDDARPCVVIVSGEGQLPDQYRPHPFRRWVTGLPLGGDIRLRAFQRNDCTAAEQALTR